MSPLIGISTYNDLAQWRDWSSPAALIPQTYLNAVRRSGGRPVLQDGRHEEIAADPGR